MFREGQPIYVQIADRLADEILAGNYEAESRVPGVRKYSALLEVNINTMVKAYDLLARRGVISQKRGLGYFVTSDARRLILHSRRHEFMEQALPEFLRRMRQLGITMDDIERAARKLEQEKAGGAEKANRQ